MRGAVLTRMPPIAGAACLPRPKGSSAGGWPSSGGGLGALIGHSTIVPAGSTGLGKGVLLGIGSTVTSTGVGDIIFGTTILTGTGSSALIGGTTTFTGSIIGIGIGQPTKSAALAFG